MIKETISKVRLKLVFKGIDTGSCTYSGMKVGATDKNLLDAAVALGRIQRLETSYAVKSVETVLEKTVA